MSTNALTLTQEIYFDICDILNGNTYTQLGYDNRQDFLLCQREKLLMIEKAIEPDQEKRCNH